MKKNVDRAANLVFPDRNAAAGALRAAVERLLTEHGVAATTPSGRFVPADQRISQWGKHGGDAEVVQLLRAVKYVGNHGSHEEPDLTVDEVLETAELLEHALERLYDDKTSRLVARAAAVNANKGPTR